MNAKRKRKRQRNDVDVMAFGLARASTTASEQRASPMNDHKLSGIVEETLVGYACSFGSETVNFFGPASNRDLRRKLDQPSSTQLDE
jgi:hypothetical protein